MKYPDSLEKLINSFEMLPGIGPKSAERLALYTVTKMSKENAKLFSNRISEAIDKIKNCIVCGNLTDSEICEICADEDRENTLMIVENTKDIIAFEKLKVYKGKYQVLNGYISPLNGVGPEDLNLNTIVTRVEREKIDKIIIALASTIPGEMTTMFIKNMFTKINKKVYQIGYGLPVGADIEYADEITLLKSLEGLKEL